MKYPAGISGEEYAAMEEGYEQGRAAAAADMLGAEVIARCEALVQRWKRQQRMATSPPSWDQMIQDLQAALAGGE